MKTGWKSVFERKILDRGFNYFLSGYVNNLTLHNDGNFSADVFGGDVYTVIITAKDNNTVTGMSCTCPYAADGKHCKHEAAVMFAIEDGRYTEEESTPASGNNSSESCRKNISEKKRVRVYPFKRPAGSDEYHYFDMESITDELVFYEDTLSQAQKIINKELLKLTSFNCSYLLNADTLDSQTAEVYISGENCLRGSMYVKFGSTNLSYINCDLTGCGRKTCYADIVNGCCDDDVCPFKLAALLLIQDYININNPGDSTDFAAKQLMNHFRIKRQLMPAEAAAAGEARVVKLLPQVSFDRDTPLLFFKIGTDKLFVLKNMHELMNTVNKKEILNLGKNDTLDFRSDYFDEKSLKLYRFMENTVSDLQSRFDSSNYYRYYETETIRDRIALYGKRLDDFFDIVCDTSVELRHEHKSASTGFFRFEDGSFKASMEFTPVYNHRNEFAGIKGQGNIPDFIKGALYIYLLRKNKLMRLDCESAERLERLSVAATLNRINFQIGRNSLNDFYRNVLPGLREIAEINIKSENEIENYLSPMPEYEFYLDAQQRIPSCIAYVKYGEEEFNIIDRKFNEISSAVRDSYSEAEVLRLVDKFFPEPDIVSQCFMASAEDDRIFDIISEGVNTLLDIGSVNVTDKFKALQKIRKPVVSVGVKVESGLLDLSISADNISNKELLDILAGYKLKKKYHRIHNGEFVSIDDTVEELSRALDALNISPKEFVSGKMKIPMYRALYLEKMSESSSGIELKRDQYFRSLMKDFKTVNDADFEVPKSLDGVLRNYQQSGFKWLKTIDHYGFGGILADDMGLGKTLQIISLILSAKEENGSVSAMIVCPASLVYNWQEEIMRFAPQLNCRAITGNISERSEKINKLPCPDVMVSSYDLLKRDIAEYSDKDFDYVVIDEAQFIKNHNTAAAKSVKLIKGKRRFALTGTPIENRLSELWSIFDFLMPGFLYSYDYFKKIYELPISRNDEESSFQLSRTISPFILRRLKGDVLKDLPEKLEEVQYAKFEPEQQKLYDAQVVRIRNTVNSSDEESFNKSKIAILAEITKARQICCDPSLLFENYKGDSAKKEACLDLIKSAVDGNHRILLFSQFTSMLSILEGELKKNDINYYILTGSTSKEERMRLVKAFNEGDVPVFMISLKAGGTGLNLTGADVVIHYDPWWNVAAQNQATDRAHRIGQTKTVSVYKLIAKGTIEEKIMQIQERKKNLADSIISADVNGLASMTKEDLMELFS